MAVIRFARPCCPLLAILLLCVACSGLLPSSHVASVSHWEDFEGTKASFDSIVPNSTSIYELGDLGFNPLSTPNLRLLNYLDVTRIFLPNPSITIADIDPQVRDCLSHGEACSGYALDLSVIDRERFGNVFLDMLGFRRYARETGWAFHAIVVIDGEYVIHKQWSGQPIVDRTDMKDRPLGPLQEIDLGSAVKSLFD